MALLIVADAPVGVPVEAVVTLSDLKAHLNITKTTADAELTGFLQAALGVVDHLAGGVLPATRTDRVSTCAGVAVLSSTPVLSVSSVTDRAGSVLDPSTYLLNGEAGLITWNTWADLYAGTPGDVEVAYMTGRPSLPWALRLAVLVIAEHLWTSQRGARPGPSPRSGFDGGETFVSGLGYAVPNQALQLLAPYQRAPSVA